MKIAEILVERTLADVGVRGGKFYLSARGENIDIPHFLQTGELSGVKGISSTKYIWADFGPNMGRDILFVMNAKEVLRLNDVFRVGYDNAEALVANNSKMIGRILSVNDVAHSTCDNLISGVFSKIPGIREIAGRGDMISVSNRALFIAHDLQRGRDLYDTNSDLTTMSTSDSMMKDVDTSKFGDWKANGLRLSSIDDYANLYYQAAKAAGWYGKECVRYFSPQNSKQWQPAISAAIIAQANIYSSESEWINQGEHFIVPPSSMVIIALPKQYTQKPSEQDKNAWSWTDSDQKRFEYYQNLVRTFKNSHFKVQVVEAGKAANSLLKVQFKRNS